MTNLYRDSKMKIQIRKAFDNFEKDAVIEIDDINGMPVSLYWRNRLKDAEIDGCVKIVKSKKRGK